MLDLTPFLVFGAPVVIWCRTAYRSGKEWDGGSRRGWCSWLVVIGDCFRVVVVGDFRRWRSFVTPATTLIVFFFLSPPPSLEVVVGGMEVAWIGCQRWSFYSGDVIGGDQMAVVRFSSVSTGVHQLSTWGVVFWIQMGRVILIQVRKLVSSSVSTSWVGVFSGGYWGTSIDVLRYGLGW
jgi:hypothetical protein